MADPAGPWQSDTLEVTVEESESPTNPSEGTETKRHRKLLIVAGVTLVLATLAFGFIYYHFLRMPPKDISGVNDAPQQDAVQLIYLDAYWFHILWMRWTIVDWILTALAAGTAVSAVINNSFSTRTSENNRVTFFDRLLVVLAVLTIVATTFDSKLHAGQLADRYRYGDLVLQGAKLDYSASHKTDDDKAALLKKWHEAQDYLASSLPSSKNPVEDKPGGTSPTVKTPPKKPARTSHR